MCGLFGILSKEKVNIDKRAIATLGTVNDVRGGDACGLFIDGKIEYGTEGDNVNFYNFFQQSELFKTSTKANIVLGHCRKASVGGKTADKAQPIVIKEGDDIKFVVLHNGTIKNYKDLAKKYIPDVDITDLSDTQVMTRIFYDAGYDCLGEYNGGAVFVIADYRSGKPVVRLWRGWSKEYSYSKETTPERPLFITMFNNRLVFSSIPEMLQCLYPELTIKTIKPNAISVFHDGKLYVEREFDRSECLQTPTATSYSGGTYNDDRDYYSGGYGGSHQYGGGTGRSYSSRKTEKEETASKTTPLVVRPQTQFPTNSFCQRNSFDFRKYGTSIHVDQRTFRFFVSKGVPAHSDYSTFCGDSIYLDGVFPISLIGYIRTRDEKPANAEELTVAFYNGILLKNVGCYKFLMNLARLWCVEFSTLENLAPYVIYSMAVYPHIKESEGVENKYVITDPAAEFVEKEFDGEVPLIFTNKILKITHGILIEGYKCMGYKDTFTAVKNGIESYVLNNRNILQLLDPDYD